MMWNVILGCPAEMADAVGAVFEREAVAVSVLAPPRQKKARVEALFDKKPDRAKLSAMLAVISDVFCRATSHPACPRGETNKPGPRRGSLFSSLTIKPVENLNWIKKVAGDYPPLRIARWTIYGSAHRAKIKDRRLALQINSTSAFGTGEHPTTKGCLLLLEEVLENFHIIKKSNNDPPTAKTKGLLSKSKFLPLPSQEGKCKALDVGCGSGILAMAFAKACGGMAVAVDHDRQSVAIARDNVRVNKLQKSVRAGASEGFGSPLVWRHAPYNVIMANIFANPLIVLAKDMRRHLATGGVVILSGILQSQAKDVLAAYRRRGFRVRKKLKLGEWVALVLG